MNKKYSTVLPARLRHLLTTILISSLPCLFGQAQEAHIIKVTGRVIDSTSWRPLQGVTVYLYQNDKDTFMAKVITDGNGQFSIQVNNTTSKGTIIFHSSGYKEKMLQLMTESSVHNIGEIKMTLDFKTLKEVTVNARREPVAFNGNKMLLDIESVPNLKHMNMLDALDYLPFLQVEDDKLKMMGNSLTILINGKPHSFYNNPKNLNALPPSAIEKIEVVLVPTARENAGRTINIILRKDYFLGWNGNFNGTGTIYNYEPMARISYWKNKMGVDISASSRGNRSKVDSYTKINSLINNIWVRQNEDQEFHSNAISFFASAFYNLDSLSTVDFQWTYNRSCADIDKNIYISSMVNGQGEKKGFSTFNNPTLSRTNSLSLNYTRKFRQPHKELYLVSLYQKNSLRNEYGLFNYNEQRIKMQHDRFFEDGLGKSLSVETGFQNQSNEQFKYLVGAKIINRWNTSDRTLITEIMNPGTGIDAKAESFDFNRLVSILFIDTDLKLGKKFVLHSGLRFENEYFNYRKPEKVSRSYNNLIPVLSLTWNKDIHFVTGNYNRDLLRPNFTSLIPFLTSSNPYIRDSGVVNLRPQVRNNYGVQYYGNYKFGNIGLNLDYSRIKDYIDEFYLIDPDGVIRKVQSNISRYNSWTAGFSIELRLWKKVSLSHFNSVSYLQQHKESQDNSMWSGYIAERIGMNLTKKHRLGLSLVAFSPNVTLQGKNQSMAYLNTNFSYTYFFTLLKKFPSNLAIGSSNPTFYKGLPSYSRQQDSDFSYYSSSKRLNPVMGISLYVSFVGRQLRDKTFNKSKSINNNDIMENRQ